MQVEFNPKGIDLPREHVLLRNETDRAIELGGWALEDASTRSHRFVFPDVSLAPGTGLRVWTTRGVNDAHNLYWGRNQAVWNNTGDAAVLLDFSGTEVVRVAWAGSGRRTRVLPDAPAGRVAARRAKAPARPGPTPLKRRKGR